MMLTFYLIVTLEENNLTKTPQKMFEYLKSASSSLRFNFYGSFPLKTKFDEDHVKFRNKIGRYCSQDMVCQKLRLE